MLAIPITIVMDLVNWFIFETSLTFGLIWPAAFTVLFFVGILLMPKEPKQRK